MICTFRKLSGKNLALLSILRLFHADKNIEIKQNQRNNTLFKLLYTDFPIEVLEVNKQNKIYGCFAIINFLTKQARDAVQMDKFWWTTFHLQERIQITLNDGTIQKKKVIQNDHLKKVNQWLEEQKFLESFEITEADIIAYLKIRQSVQDIKLSKIQQWAKVTGASVDPIVDELRKQFQKEVKDNAKQGNKKEKTDKTDKDEKQQEAPKEQQKKSQQQQKQQKEPNQQQQQVKVQKQQPQGKKEKVDENIPAEYLDKLNNLKIKRTNQGEQILPHPQKRNILVTSALPYVNNVPHLGNIIGCVLSADVFARYCRLRGYNTLYICGTDEYGTATEVKAIQEGCTPQQICDKYFKVHSDVYKWFDIDFDYFGRTSTKIHTKITQDIFLQLHPQYTTNHTKPQTYCPKCTMFLADRYVSGVCPHCAYEDARGDQCDHCQKLLDPMDLKDAKCTICKTTPEIKDTTHIYINLPSIQPQLEEWITKAQAEGQWSENSVSVSKAWLKQGLKERCITRDLKWGTQVPLEEFKHKVFYVWFDAPIGYLSITGNFIQDWQSWWKNPENVKLYQFMGKDNIPFHTVIFPSTLIGTKDKYTLLHRLSTTEYLNYEDGKFSKTRGVGVFGDDMFTSGIPTEVIRYYLLINRPEKSDSIFTWQDFVDKNNNELLPNIGNLLNRTLKFMYKKYDQKVPDFSADKLNQNDRDFIDGFLQVFEQQYIQAMEQTEIKEGLKKAMELSKKVNKYLQDEKAWEEEQIKSKRSDVILGVASCAIRVLSAAFEPFMPSLSAKINFLLGFETRTVEDDHFFTRLLNNEDNVTKFLGLVPSGQKINLPVALFRTYSTQELESWKAKYGGKQQQQ